jgi:PAS domain S-box-containing protein
MGGLMFKLSYLDATAWFEGLRSRLEGHLVVEARRHNRLNFRDHPLPARFWLILVAVFYVGTALWVAPHTRPIVLTALIPIFTLAALMKPVPHPRGGILDASSGISMTAALIWTPPEVILGIGIGSLVGGRVFRRVEWWRVTNNAASWGISGGLAATMAQSAMSVLPQGFLQIITGASVAMFAHFVTNRAMFSIYRSCRFGRPFLREWRQSLSFSWPQAFFELPVVVVIAAIAYAMSDLAWSLAITTAATLFLPITRWVDRRLLDITMQRRASVALSKTQVLPHVLTDTGLSEGVKGPPSRLITPPQRLVYDRGSSSAPPTVFGIDPQVIDHLQQSQTRFCALIEHMSDGISLLNAEGTILYLSQSVSQVLGYGISEYVGRSWFEIYYPGDLERVRAMFSSMLQEPGGHFAAEARMLHKDGSWRWVHTHQVNLLMEPSVQAIVVTYRDNTQWRRSEETLEEYVVRLKDLSRRLVQAQETERRRIAHELHDETGQILTGLKLTLDVALKQIGERESKSTLSRAAAMLETLQKQVRTLSLNLRPVALDDLGLIPAVLMLCDQYAAQTSVHVKTIHDGVSGRRFAPEVETTAYRIVQEGLTNIARHASVHEATVRLWTDEEVLGIQVEDFGKGFAVESTEFVDRASGLSGMRERVLLVGGEFAVESTLGTGTRLTVELPIRHNVTQ